MSLMDDLECVVQGRYPGILKDSPQYKRLCAFIQANQPWLPPQQEGFGPWVEYRVGDKGPHVNDLVMTLTVGMRRKRMRPVSYGSPPVFKGNMRDDSTIVAYCVKLGD